MNEGKAPEESAATLRQELLRRFEAWLGDVLADEPPPEGVDAQVVEAQGHASNDESDRSRRAPCDLFALWSAMTSLTQEVKLQGRTFKQLQETLSPVSALDGKLSRLGKSQDQTLDSLGEIAGELRASIKANEQARNSDRQWLDVLLDLHGRLKRGLELCQKYAQELPERTRPSFWARLFRPQVGEPLLKRVEALEEGYALTVQRLEESLREHNICPVECLGKAFDPHTMEAVNVAPSDDHPEGTVLEIYQPGFKCDGQVLRLTKVKVAGRCGKGGAHVAEKEFVT